MPPVADYLMKRLEASALLEKARERKEPLLALGSDAVRDELLEEGARVDEHRMHPPECECEKGASPCALYLLIDPKRG